MKTIKTVDSVKVPAYAVVNLDTNSVVELCTSRDIARIVLKFHKLLYVVPVKVHLIQ